MFNFDRAIAKAVGYIGKDLDKNDRQVLDELIRNSRALVGHLKRNLSAEEQLDTIDTLVPLMGHAKDIVLQGQTPRSSGRIFMSIIDRILTMFIGKMDIQLDQEHQNQFDELVENGRDIVRYLRNATPEERGRAINRLAAFMENVKAEILNEKEDSSSLLPDGKRKIA